MGQKHAWEKNCTELLFFNDVVFHFTKDKKENCQKIQNLGEVFHNRLRVLSRKGLG